MKKVLLIFFSLLWFTAHAQLICPAAGRYKNCGAQAMAIWDHYAYVFNDGGHCRVFDLSTSDMNHISEFDLASATAENHVNAACFGCECPEGSDMPYIYISECKNNYRCFVERITPKETSLVQTINTSFAGKSLHAPIWVVDTKEKILYRVGRTNETLQTKGYSINTIMGFRLPSVNEGKEVTLTEKDVICKFDVLFSSILQDACIRNGKMYMATGLQQSYAARLDSKRAIQVIDLKKKELIKTSDQTMLTTNEPEGIDFYNRKLLMFCGQEGGIYRVKL